VIIIDPKLQDDGRNRVRLV